MNRRAFGNAGKKEAGEDSGKRGWTILDRNVRRGRGEIDIVARKKGTVAFVEVKRRSGLGYGRPAEAVGREKQMRIARAALLYMQEHRLSDARIRFDIIEILPGEIQHIEGAFDATDLF